MIFNDKVKKIKQNRSNALNNKIMLKKAELEAIDENDFNISYLFGVGYSGISDFIKLYYTEMEQENNTVFNYPILSNYTKAEWDNIFNEALNYTLSPALYINDKNHNYGQDIQAAGISAWFNTNGKNVGTTGLLSVIENVINKVGNNATVLGTYTSNYSYSTAANAHAAAVSLAKTTNWAGTTLKGKRSCDLIDPDNNPNGEITTDFDGTDSYRFNLGDGNIENVNYYTNPEKNDLLNSITSLISSIDNNSNYQSNLNIIYDELDKLYDVNHINHNEKIYLTNITNDIIDDRSTITNYISSINNSVGVNTDVLANNTLYGYKNYFTSAIGNEGDFNTSLDNLVTLCNSIQNLINTRNGTLDNIVGTTENDRFKKHRLFWSKTIIKKPDGSLTTISSVEQGSMAYNNVIKQIESANNELSVLFNNKDEWIMTPELYASYYDPKINKKTKIIEDDISYLIFSGQAHAEGYKIYRKEMNPSLINNNNWITGEIEDFTDIGDNGDVKTTYKDSNVLNDKIYLYRISIYDTINDINSSASNQSKIYDDINYFTITTKIVDDGLLSKVNIGSHKFKKNTYGVIRGDSDFFVNILDVDEENIWINKIDTNFTGTIHYTSALVYTNLV